MPGLKAIGVSGLAILAGLGVVMMITNPSQSVYEEFAARRLSQYLKDEVCTKVPDLLGNSLQTQCVGIVDSSQPQMQQIISANTRQQNFLLFSIYTTDLSISSIVPSYHFVTIGALQNFYIYQAEQR